MSSRLTLDGHGRLIAEGTCLELRGLRWVVRDWFTVLAFTPRGRPPTAREIARTRAPYSSTSAKRARLEVPDDQLDDQAAIEAAYREQRREPADLLSAA